MNKTDWPKEALTSDIMHMLSNILDRWCDNRGLSRQSPEAKTLARSLVDWYEFGVRDHAELSKLIDDELPL